MRSKITGGGRPRFTNLAPKPSAMAFTYLCPAQSSLTEPQPDWLLNNVPVNEPNDNSSQRVVPKSSTDSDDVGRCHNSSQRVVHEPSSDSDDFGRCHDIAPNASGDTVFPVTKSHGWGSQDVHEPEDFSKMDWTEKAICIKCNKAGKVLVCNDRGCPIAVHEKCMGCSARFDDMGNFHCPYCQYKHAIAESHEVREKAMLAKKALSTFINKDIIDGNQQNCKMRTAIRKVLPPPTVAGNIIFSGSGNMLKVNDVHKQSVQLEEDQQVEGFSTIHTVSMLPCKGTDTSIVNKLSDVLLTKCGDYAGHCDHCRVIVENRTHSEPIIACGGDCVCCREEGTTHQFEIVEVGKRVQADHDKPVYNYQHGGVFEAQQQAGHLSAFPAEEETTLSDALDVSTKGKWKNIEIFEENEGRRTEEKHMQEQAQETTVSFTVAEPALQVHSKSNRGVETSETICRDIVTFSTLRRHVKQKDENIVQPPSVHSPRRLSIKLSSELVNSAVKNEKIISRNKLRQLEEPSKRSTSPLCPNARRRKWSHEEEEMLKEGVQRFSTTVNKNLPWRKILDIGRHVFESTRTPADLKDKWRNVMAKERLTK